MELQINLTDTDLTVSKDGQTIYTGPKTAHHALAFDGLHIATLSAAGSAPCAEGVAIHPAAPFQFQGKVTNERSPSRADVHLEFTTDLEVSLYGDDEPAENPSTPFLISSDQDQVTLTTDSAGIRSARGFNHNVAVIPKNGALALVPMVNPDWVPLDMPFNLETTDTGLQLTFAP